MRRFEQATTEWAVGRNQLPPIARTVWAEFARRHGQARRAACHGGDVLDLLAWGRRYLPKHFSRPPSAMHRWLAECIRPGRTAW